MVVIEDKGIAGREFEPDMTERALMFPRLPDTYGVGSVVLV